MPTEYTVGKVFVKGPACVSVGHHLRGWNEYRLAFLNV